MRSTAKLLQVRGVLKEILGFRGKTEHPISVQWDRWQAVYDTLCPSRDPGQPGPPFITTTKGMSGYFAVMYHWSKTEHGGFWEPYDTGMGRYATKAEAEAEAIAWSEMDQLDFIPSGAD